MSAVRFVRDIWVALKDGFVGLFEFATEEPFGALALACCGGFPLLLIAMATR